MAASRRGFTMVEVLMAALIMSLIIIAYLCLGGQETVSTREVRDRAHALAVARNLICLIRNRQSCDWLSESGTPQSGGGFLTPVATVPGLEHALGTALEEWMDRNGASVSLVWKPDTTSNGIGRLTCFVQWENARGFARQVHVPAVLRR